MNGRLLGDEGHALAQKALGYMDQFNIPPTPENYAVWITFCAEANTELADTVKGHIESGDEFTDALNAELFDQYFQWKAIQDAILETGGQMSQELNAVSDRLEAAKQDTADYGKTLDVATSALHKAAPEDGNIKKMVETLVSATARMQRRSHDLERKLHQTSAEVTKLRSNLEKVREESMTDALTGVANRKRFDEALRKARRDSDATGQPLSLILCDIDYFKRFNDTWGHQTGDQIIRFVAGCLSRTAEDGCLVARYGGEEFGVVMPNTSPDDAAEYAERVRKTVESKKLLRKSTNEDLGNITISLGVTEYASGESLDVLVERADTNLYASKTDGRNRVTLDKKKPTSTRSAA